MSPTSISALSESQDDALQERHDVMGALQTLHMAVASLEGGYQFDDHRAELKVIALRRAATILNRFCTQQLARDGDAP